jgi:adenosine deaminase
MFGRHSSARMFMTTVITLTFVLCCTVATPAQSPGTQMPEQKTAQYFETIRQSPSQLWSFLLKLPKGADLHNHLSGSIYAESYIQWAAEKGLCVNNQTMALSMPPTPSACDPKLNQIPANAALTNSVLFQQLVDAWSMRNWQLASESGHDHFFNSFGRFGTATWDQTGRMLAEAATRAAHGQVLYLELMLTPDGTMSSDLGKQVVWDGNVDSTLNKLKTAGIAKNAAAGSKALQDAETQKDQFLKCGTPQADPGCAVTIRYVAQVSRGGSLGSVFAQMVTGFTLASDPSSKVVALNLVQGEDGAAAMQNFSVQMQMLNSLRSLYPKAHLTLHAGELAPGLVPPAGLTFHIRESVVTAGAERIGHGVDIMHEDRPEELFKEMARRHVMVEICLSSNDTILGISGSVHPLATYLKFGVPVALATDDEGVSRSEISREFLRAVQDQGLGYVQLKMMARNSLQYAFIAGGSLWSNADRQRFVPVSQCRDDMAAMKLVTNSCRDYVAGSEKAKLQWQLEENFKAFESAY